MKYWTILDEELNPVKMKRGAFGIKLLKAKVDEFLMFDKLEDAYDSLLNFNESLENTMYDIDVKLPLQVGVVDVDVKFYTQDKPNNIKVAEE